MVTNSWVDLEKECPIDISTIIKYAKELKVNLVVDTSDLDSTKERLICCGGSLTMMISTLMQLLADPEIRREPTDKLLFKFLKEDFGRYLSKLDDEKSLYLVVNEAVDPSRDKVSVSRITSYANLLQISADSLIYEPLFKATKEYNKLEVKEKRIFLYMLFEIIQITLSVLGSKTRDQKKSSGSKNFISDITPSYTALMSDKGQELIKKGYEEDFNGSEKGDLENHMSLLYEEFEEDSEEDSDESSEDLMEEDDE